MEINLSSLFVKRNFYVVREKWKNHTILTKGKKMSRDIIFSINLTFFDLLKSLVHKFKTQNLRKNRIKR